MWMQDGTPLSIAAAGYHAQIAAQAGGRVARFFRQGRHGSVELLRPWDGTGFDAHTWPKAGAFPMLPFTNRLSTQGLQLDGRVAKGVHGTQGYPLHGLGLRRKWLVKHHSADQVELELDHSGQCEEWPWRFRALQTFHLTEDGLAWTLTVENRDTVRMPLAMGWHPYCSVDSDCRISDPEHARRFDMDDSGTAVPDQGTAGVGVRAGATVAYDQWDGQFNMPGPAGGRLCLQASGLGALVMHRSVRGDYLCVEPVTALPGRLAAHTDDPALWTAPGAQRQISVLISYTGACI